jgi:hypothetical protein
MQVAGSLTFTDTIAIEDDVELDVLLPQPTIDAAITTNPTTAHARTLGEQNRFIHFKFICFLEVDMKGPSKRFFTDFHGVAVGHPPLLHDQVEESKPGSKMQEMRGPLPDLDLHNNPFVFIELPGQAGISAIAYKTVSKI